VNEIVLVIDDTGDRKKGIKLIIETSVHWQLGQN